MKFVCHLEYTFSSFSTNQALIWIGDTLVYWTVRLSKKELLRCCVCETMIRISIRTGKLSRINLIALGHCDLFCSLNAFTSSQN